MKRYFLLVAVCFASYIGHSQVGIGNVDPKSQLDISATNVASPSNTDGILIPRVDNFPSSDPGADQDGMLVFVTGNGTPAEGFYYWDNGTTSWVTVGGGGSDSDWYEVGTSTPANNINDNIFHLGNIAVGSNTTSGTSPFFVTGDVSADLSNISSSVSGVFSAGTYSSISNSSSLSDAGNYTGISNVIGGSIDGTITGVNNTISTTGTGQKIGFLNTFNSADGVRKGFRNYFAAGNSISMGLENQAPGAFSVSGALYGLKNDLSSAGNGQRYGVHTVINGTGTGAKYGEFIQINSSAGGQHYGLYSNVQSASGYAGYFIGRASFGTDPSTGRYLLPASDGTAGQMLTTDGSGQLGFSDPVIEDIDWYEVGTTSAPNNIGDNIFTQGEVAIGSTSNPSNVMFYTETDPTSNSTGVQHFMQPGNVGLLKGVENSLTVGGTASAYALSNNIGGNSSSLSIQAVRNSFSGSGGRKTGMYNSFITTFGGEARGAHNDFNSSGITNAFGSYNSFTSLSSTAIAQGTFNTASSSTNVSSLYGERTIFSGASVSGSAYGQYSFIQTSGTDYGIYAHVDNNAIDYAGYFIGRTSFGTDAAVGRYLMPSTDGTSGQVMTTDGSGNVSFQSVPMDGTGTDDQTIDTFGLVGNTLGLSLEDDGQAVQTVDLSNVNFNVSNFALAKMTLSANQSITLAGVTKVNFDTAAIDLGSNFNTSNDRFEVSEAGVYRITAALHSFSASTITSNVELRIYVNGTMVKSAGESHTGSGVISRQVSTIQALAASQYIEVQVFAVDSFSISASDTTTSFEVERIR